MVSVFFHGVTRDEDVVEVDIAEIQSCVTSSISLWNAWAELANPIGSRLNSNSPQGVITAVLCLSSSAMGIWWYPFVDLAEQRFAVQLSCERSAILLRQYSFLV